MTLTIHEAIQVRGLFLGQLHLVVVSSQMVSLHFLSVDPYGPWSFLTQYSIAVSSLLYWTEPSLIPRLRGRREKCGLGTRLDRTNPYG